MNQADLIEPLQDCAVFLQQEMDAADQKAKRAKTQASRIKIEARAERINQLLCNANIALGEARTIQRARTESTS